jgi:hypothetical protein
MHAQARQAAESAVVAAGQAAHTEGARTFESDAAAADYGRTVWSGVLDRLTPSEYDATGVYMGSYYKTINQYLREELNLDRLTPRDWEIIRSTVRDLDTALYQRTVPQDITVVRATIWDELGATGSDAEGTSHLNHAYLSTSLATNALVGGPESLVLHLTVPAGTPALFMEETLNRVTEGQHPLRDLSQELLLGRGTSYHIDTVVWVGGRWHAFGRVQPRR